MQLKAISKILSRFLFGYAILLLVPLAFSIYYDFYWHDDTPLSTGAFFLTLMITLSLGGALYYLGKKAGERFYRKEAIIFVVSTWVLACLIGALPYFFSKTLLNPLDALFESISGFTTTGSSVFLESHYATTPLPVLFWRCLTQWVGGIGIVFCFLAFFPALSIGGKFLLNTETARSNSENLVPRAKETASILWKIYVGFTALQVLFILLFDDHTSFWDALLLSFATVSTGGFSIYASSIAGYQSAVVEWITMVFMVLGAISFPLYFFIWRMQWRRLRDPELLFFAGSLLFFCGMMIWQLSTTMKGPFVRIGLFETISTLSSTGFTAANYNLWPLAPQVLLFLAMYVGGMSGSTSGGIKSARHLILFRSLKNQLESLFRPAVKRVLFLGGHPLSNSALLDAFLFFWIAIIFSTIAIFLLVYDRFDMVEAFSLVANNINNVGLGGPGSGSYASLSPFSKWVVMGCMFFGRLEYFALLILFVPTFWKR